MASSSEIPTRSFDSPQEPEWHRVIAEAAYYLAEKRGFWGEHALDDWLTAEQQVRPVSLILKSKKDAIDHGQPETGARRSTVSTDQLHDGQIYAQAT